MALQKKVNIASAPGVAGDKATPDQSIYTPVNYIAGDNGVTAGSFCWIDSTNPDVVNGTSSDDTVPVGFVERNLSYPQYNTTVDGSLVIPAGQTPNIAVRGDYFAVVTDKEAKAGGAVYVDKTNGKILAEKGSNGIDTGWVFHTSAKKDELAIISSWPSASASAVAAAQVDLTKAIGQLDLASKVTGHLAVINGGTGAYTADNARTNLDVYSKAEVDGKVAG